MHGASVAGGVGSVVDLRVARAHVDRRLADLADALRDRDDPRHVVVVREVVGLADGLQMTGARSKIAEPGGEAERGEQRTRPRRRRRRRARSAP